MKQQKVFCLGFHKTGTTSLGVALGILGYRVSGAFGVNDPDIAEHAVEQRILAEGVLLGPSLERDAVQGAHGPGAVRPVLAVDEHRAVRGIIHDRANKDVFIGDLLIIPEEYGIL